MKTKQKISLSQKTKQDIREDILGLLEKEEITKDEIFQSVQDEYSIATSELRVIVKEIRTEFLNKLNVLQSGIVRL